jgi:excisionase family DNA binding protein
MTGDMLINIKKDDTMIETTFIIPILERLDRIESIVTDRASKNDPLMTLKDVSNYARVCEATIRRAIHKGTIKPFKSSGKKLFRREDVDSWLQL